VKRRIVNMSNEKSDGRTMPTFVPGVPDMYLNRFLALAVGRPVSKIAEMEKTTVGNITRHKRAWRDALNRLRSGDKAVINGLLTCSLLRVLQACIDPAHADDTRAIGGIASALRNLSQLVEMTRPTEKPKKRPQISKEAGDAALAALDALNAGTEAAT
jgi:hypothetical protein